MSAQTRDEGGIAVESGTQRAWYRISRCTRRLEELLTFRRTHQLTGPAPARSNSAMEVASGDDGVV